MKSLALLFLPLVAIAAEPPIDAEVCVYGGTPSGVMAAVAAARLGARFRSWTSMRTRAAS